MPSINEVAEHIVVLKLELSPIAPLWKMLVLWALVREILHAITDRNSNTAALVIRLVTNSCDKRAARNRPANRDEKPEL